MGHKKLLLHVPRQGIFASMDLRTYLKSRDETVAAFAVRAGRPVETVRNWVYRQKSPSLEAAAQVEQLTDGCVTAAELIVPRRAAEPAPAVRAA